MPTASMPSANGQQASLQPVDVVRQVIDNWDPYDLLAGGAPPDEFEAEIADVTIRIGEIASADDAARVLSDIFTKAFGPKYFSVAECAGAGRTLYHELRRHGFIR